jgi:hypothetical protein
MIRPARLAFPMVHEINQPGGAVTPSIDAQVRAHLTKRSLSRRIRLRLILDE